MTSPIGPFGGPNLAQQLARLVQSPRFQKTVGVHGPAQAGAVRGGPLSLGQGSSFGAGIATALNQPQQQQDPMAELYQQLISQLQSPVQQPQAIDTQGLMEQIQKALNPLYDQRASAAQGQSDRARAETKDMYRALSNDYERLAPQQAAQAQQNQADVSELYGQLRSNIQGNYARVSQEQADQFQRLGIEDALPEVLQDQAAPVNDALTAASENQTQQQQRYQDIGDMDQTFYREGSPNATMAGNEISTDLLNQLGDYLSRNEAERTSGVQSAYMDQLGQAQSQYAQQQQAANSQTNQNQQMLWQMLQSQLKGNQQQQPLTPDSYMSQLDPQAQQSVAGAFTKLQRSPEAIYGKVEDPRNPTPGSYVETTPEWYLQQADQLYQSGQIDARTRQELLQYIQLYYGMGKG
jgi:hypothetical protein